MWSGSDGVGNVVNKTGELNMRTRKMALALAVTAGILMTPGAALAVGPIPVAMASDYSYDVAAAEREFVLWLINEDERPAVRSAARTALLGGPEAITQFLLTGWDAAILRHETTRKRNFDFTTRMVNTHPVQYYPWVNGAGRLALAGSDADLQAFVSTGYAAALDKDRRNIEYDKGKAAEVLQWDRDFVVRLSTEDPGPQVREWAFRAKQGTDADIAEFFKHGWVTASNLDVQMHRNRVANLQRAWQNTSRGLVADAKAAEEAARGLAGEAKKQQLAAAARAWALVGAQTGPARVAWADAETVALRQADTWLAVSQAAGTATSSNWETIAGTSLASREEWLAEMRNANNQAATWSALYQQALEAETVLTQQAS